MLGARGEPLYLDERVTRGIKALTLEVCQTDESFHPHLRCIPGPLIPMWVAWSPHVGGKQKISCGT